MRRVYKLNIDIVFVYSTYVFMFYGVVVEFPVNFAWHSMNTSQDYLTIIGTVAADSNHVGIILYAYVKLVVHLNINNMDILCFITYSIKIFRLKQSLHHEHITMSISII